MKRGRDPHLPSLVVGIGLVLFGVALLLDSLDVLDDQRRRGRADAAGESHAAPGAAARQRRPRASAPWYPARTARGARPAPGRARPAGSGDPPAAAAAACPTRARSPASAPASRATFAVDVRYVQAAFVVLTVFGGIGFRRLRASAGRCCRPSHEALGAAAPVVGARRPRARAGRDPCWRWPSCCCCGTSASGSATRCCGRWRWPAYAAPR